MTPKSGSNQSELQSFPKASASAAVASACMGAVLIASARAAGSRRKLSKEVDIHHSVISDIEDASVLPSIHQLGRLRENLNSIQPQYFDPARMWGEIPWTDCLIEIFEDSEKLRETDIAATIAALEEGLSASEVQWRLTRQLSRLESSGILIQERNKVWRRPKSDKRTQSGSTRQARRHQHVLDSETNPEHDAFFHLESEPGHHRIVLNRTHPIYGDLHNLLSLASIDEINEEQLRERLQRASLLLRELLVAWAEYEDGEKVGQRQDRVREARQIWGRNARRLAEVGEVESTTVTL